MKHIIISLSFFLLDFIILSFTSVGSCKTFYLIHDNYGGKIKHKKNQEHINYKNWSLCCSILFSNPLLNWFSWIPWPVLPHARDPVFTGARSIWGTNRMCFQSGCRNSSYLLNFFVRPGVGRCHWLSGWFSWIPWPGFPHSSMLVRTGTRHLRGTTIVCFGGDLGDASFLLSRFFSWNSGTRCNRLLEKHTRHDNNTSFRLK